MEGARRRTGFDQILTSVKILSTWLFRPQVISGTAPR